MEPDSYMDLMGGILFDGEEVVGSSTTYQDHVAPQDKRPSRDLTVSCTSGLDMCAVTDAVDRERARSRVMSRRVTFSESPLSPVGSEVQRHGAELSHRITGRSQLPSGTAVSSTSGFLGSCAQIGGYITIDDEAIAELRPENFEIIAAQESVHDPDMAGKFRFERSARKSVLLHLGLGDIRTVRSTGQDAPGTSAMDVYAKIDADKCATIYMGCMIGIGSLQLSGAMAKCGLVPGLLTIAMFSWLHRFLCHRLVEVPQLVEQSFELYAGVAKVCLPGFMYRPTALACTMTWFSACFIFEKTTLMYLFKVITWGRACTLGSIYELAMKVAKPMAILVLIPVAWSTNVSLVSKCARWSVRAMFTAGLFELVGAALYSYNEKPAYDFQDWDWVGNNIVEGIQKMALAFIGIGILPYIVAEMVHTQEAGKMIDKACRNIFSFYTVMATVCYLAWGKTVLMCESSPMTTLFDLAVQNRGVTSGSPRWLTIAWAACGTVTFVCFVVKAICSFPMFLWPLVREVEGAVAWDATPAAEIQVPWASKGAIFRRKLLKASLVVLMVGPLMVPERYYDPMEEFIVYCPMAFTHCVLPAIAAFVAIWQHWAIVDHRQSRELTIRRIESRGRGFWSTMPHPKTRTYYGGSFQAHFIIAGAACFISVLFFTVLIAEWGCELVHAFTRPRHEVDLEVPLYCPLVHNMEAARCKRELLPFSQNASSCGG